MRHLSRVMAALWCVLFVVSAAAPSPHCTPLDPSVCAPDQGLAVFGSLLLAAPVLLLWLPSVGALVTLAWGLAAQTTTLPVLPRLLWLALGLACLSLPLLQHGRRPWGPRPWRRQRRPSWHDASHHLHADEGPLASGISHSAELIGFPVLHHGAPSRWQRLPNVVRLSTRATVVALLAFGSAVSFLWYAHDTAAEQRHLDHSHVVTGQVVGYDDPQDPIDIVVGLPSGRAHIEVAETDIYPVGRQVPVRVDPTDASWAELVAEPNDSTFFRDAGGALALLAMVAGVQAARRLL